MSMDVIGWDVGGAHLKACWLHDGHVRDVAQWACPLWQGMDKLDAAFVQAGERWPVLRDARHALTMTGELVDGFEHREQGVQAIVASATRWLAHDVAYYAGRAGWATVRDVLPRWRDVASANWLATAAMAAAALGDGVLVDIGSTTTDLIALRAGRVATQAASDVDRLASGELAYHGVVRTPLCGVAHRIAFGGRTLAVMNEFFATAADVYRITGELDEAHDLYPAADNGAKNVEGSRRRIARMIGLDARDADDQAWLAFARAWRAAQLDTLGASLQRVLDAAALPREGDAAALSRAADAAALPRAADAAALPRAADAAALPRAADAAAFPPRAPLVSAGAGDFLVPELAARFGRPHRAFIGDVVPLHETAGKDVARWAQVCAPSVAVAQLLLKAGPR